jgi:anti-sigma factor RsiW
MTMTTEPTRHDPADAALDDLFAQVRAGVEPVPDALLARVLADADAAMPRAAALHPASAAARPGPGWLGALVALLGGRSAVAGMAAAGLAGVWIGFAQPVALPFDSYGAAETVTLYPAALDLWGEILTADPALEG